MTTHRIYLVAAVFTLVSTSAAAQPAATTLITPSSDVTSTTIAFSWQSAPTATWYQLWLGKSDASLVLEQWLTAEHADCAEGGLCTITLTLPIKAGAFVWYIRPWASSGYGPWSAAQMFTMKDMVQAWSGLLPPSRRFTLVITGAGVLDNETGLVWQRAVSPSVSQWPAAQVACATTEVGGRFGWRVPALSELQTLIDSSQSSPSVPAGHPFFNMDPAGEFWTNTAATTVAGHHWVVNFTNGTMSLQEAANLRVWCVRGGMLPAQ
jgi:hypothetical protein